MCIHDNTRTIPVPGATENQRCAGADLFPRDNEEQFRLIHVPSPDHWRMEPATREFNYAVPPKNDRHAALERRVRQNVEYRGERMMVMCRIYCSTNVLCANCCIEKAENFKVGALTLTLSCHLLLRREERETELRMAPDGGGHKMASQNPVPFEFWITTLILGIHSGPSHPVP
jgi:hypothetical protein